MAKRLTNKKRVAETNLENIPAQSGIMLYTEKAEAVMLVAQRQGDSVKE